MNYIFDKIYVINLDFRNDRWKYIYKHLTDIGINNFERVSATKLDIDCNISKIKLSQISCFHSHLKTLRKAQLLNLESVLILEDDCKFINCENLNQINKNVDILYLGCNRKIYKNNNNLTYLSKIYKVNDFMVKIDECGTTHAILYSKKVINKIIDLYPTDEIFFQKAFTFEEKFFIYDNFLNWFTEQNNIQKYAMCPVLCTQFESFSDIQYCNTNYESEILNSWL